MTLFNSYSQDDKGDDDKEEGGDDKEEEGEDKEEGGDDGEDEDEDEPEDVSGYKDILRCRRLYGLILSSSEMCSPILLSTKVISSAWHLINTH